MTKKSKEFSSLFSSVYVPEYNASDKELLRGVQTAPLRTLDDIKEEVEDKVKAIQSLLDSDFIKPGEYFEPRILSVEEGQAHQNDKERILKDIERVRKKMKNLESLIDSKLEDNFTWKFKKRPKLRKALKHITGKAKSSITYADYKKALEIKKKLEMEGADEYWERTED